MNFYKIKSKPLSGTDYHEVYRKAFSVYKKISAQSKRRPYIRSAYFNNQKVFLSLFWRHLDQKHWRDRVRRMKYLPCAFELIRFCKISPSSKKNPNKNETLHRFQGITSNGEIFFVQIKENKNTGQKWLMSVFPK